jgi:hypothetical protein
MNSLPHVLLFSFQQEALQANLTSICEDNDRLAKELDLAKKKEKELQQQLQMVIEQSNGTTTLSEQEETSSPKSIRTIIQNDPELIKVNSSPSPSPSHLYPSLLDLRTFFFFLSLSFFSLTLRRRMKQLKL